MLLFFSRNKHSADTIGCLDARIDTVGYIRYVTDRCRAFYPPNWVIIISPKSLCSLVQSQQYHRWMTH
jgi:hypothetical protein